MKWISTAVKGGTKWTTAERGVRTCLTCDVCNKDIIAAYYARSTSLKIYCPRCWRKEKKDEASN